tara:strand:- start:473 stop:823 length:351 start_codon:yes stop_codon:yes gene_type:complete
LYFAPLPAPVRPLIAALARRDTLRSLRGQGVGRHSAAEVAAMGCRDIETVAAVLGNQEFMMGAEPSGIDATAYAFLAAILAVPIESPVRQQLQQSDNLTDYCQRLRERCFPDEKTA